ncbi:hypothetical protein V6N13_111208 [Hibiscus sabdariffa]
MATSVTSTHFSPEEHTYSLHTNETLICTLVSSLGLFCIVKCANREGGSTSVAAEPGVSSSPKLPDLGVEQEALNAFPVVKYAAPLELPGLDTACVICCRGVSPDFAKVQPRVSYSLYRHVACFTFFMPYMQALPD